MSRRAPAGHALLHAITITMVLTLLIAAMSTTLITGKTASVQRQRQAQATVLAEGGVTLARAWLRQADAQGAPLTQETRHYRAGEGEVRVDFQRAGTIVAVTSIAALPDNRRPLAVEIAVDLALEDDDYAIRAWRERNLPAR